MILLHVNFQEGQIIRRYLMVLVFIFVSEDKQLNGYNIGCIIFVTAYTSSPFLHYIAGSVEATRMMHMGRMKCNINERETHYCGKQKSPTFLNECNRNIIFIQYDFLQSIIRR